MKTLLAIINEPATSKKFIFYVANMATDLKANAHLLYVQTPIIYPIGTASPTGAAVAQVQQNQEAQAQTAIETLGKHIKDVKSKISEDLVIDCSSEIGVATMITDKLVSDHKADMVILEGQENESFLTQTSSNMEIINNVNCPAWIIPNDSVYNPFVDIIYATDYKEEDISGLKKLIALTNHFSPAITALHITDTVDFEEKVKKSGFLEMLQKKTAYDNLSVEVLNESSSNNTAELLNNYALNSKANLIVVLKENKSFFERIFKSDHAKKIIKKSMLPVLVLREKE